MRIDNRHPVRHQFFRLTSPQNALGDGELTARVDAERALVVVCRNCPDLLPRITQNAEHIGQIVLALCVLIRHLGQR